ARFVIRRTRRQCFRNEFSLERSNGIEQSAAVPNEGYAKVLQILSSQAEQNFLIDRIVAECRLVLPKAKSVQPRSDVHVAPHPISSPSPFRVTVSCTLLHRCPPRSAPAATPLADASTTVLGSWIGHIIHLNEPSPLFSRNLSHRGSESAKACCAA